MMPAINADGIARDIAASIRHQKDQEIAQFIHLSESTQWHFVGLRGANAGFRERIELVPRIFGWKRTRRYRIDANPFWSPFDRQRHRHRMNRSLCHRSRHHVSRSGPDPSHQIADDHPGETRGNPAFPARLCCVKRSIHNRRPDRFVAARRQGFGRREKIGTGIVHEAGERSCGPDIRHHFFDAVRIANVGDQRVGLATRSLVNFADGIVENFLSATANEDVCPVRGESHRHFLAEARSAAGHQDSLSLENISAKHERAHPSISRSALLLPKASRLIRHHVKIDTLLYFMCKSA